MSSEVLSQYHSFQEVLGLRVHVWDSDGSWERAPEGARCVLLVCMHGFLASLESFVTVREQIKRQVESDSSIFLRVIAYDRPAFGLTAREFTEGSWEDSPLGANPYTTAFSLRLLEELCQRYAPPNQEDRFIVLYGHSAGGTFGLQTTATSTYFHQHGLALIAEDAPTQAGAPPSFVKYLAKSYPWATSWMLRLMKRYYRSLLDKSVFDLGSIVRISGRGYSANGESRSQKGRKRY